MNKIPLRIHRNEFELPFVSDKLGWKYHHLGIPTNQSRSGEVYLKEYKMYVTGFDSSPYGIEWMRFEPDSPITKLIQEVPHIAFEVENLEQSLEGQEMIGEISSPMAGIKVAMIIHDGAPIELMEFDRS